MQRQQKLATALGLAGLLICGTTQAADTQSLTWYAGISAGISTLDITGADWNDGSLTSSQVDESGVAYQAFAGYHFNEHIDLELAYIRLGDSSFRGVASGQVPSVWKPGNVTGSTEAKGVSTLALASWTFGQRVKVYAKGGLFFWDSTVVYEPTIAATSVVDDPDQSNRSVVHDDGVSFIYGLGADWRLYKNWWLRAEWQQTTVGLVKTDEYTDSFPSLGLVLHF